VTEVFHADSNVTQEVSRLTELARSAFSMLEEFTRRHGPQVLLVRPLHIEAATELACIVSDCRTISEGLRRLLCKLPSGSDSEPN
jgi:hypothetical protein